MNKAKWLLTGLALLFCCSTRAQLIDSKGDFTSTNDVTPRTFKFRAAAGKLVVKYSVDSRPGAVAFEFRAPDGSLVERQSAGVAKVGAWSVNIAKGGDYDLVVTPQRTVGHWEVRVDAVPALGALYGQIVSGALMILVALVAVLFWWFHSRVQWRWFWAGAGIWTVGVALKFAVALPLNPILFGKTGHLVGLQLWVGSIYCGLMTGIFEIGVTLAAALVWRRLAAEPDRAVAVGLGAGAFEALLLGLAACGGSLVAVASGQTDLMLKTLAGVSAHTPLLWLVGPVERVIAILAHTTSRVLVLRAVAGRRWAGFWAGFAWLSAIDLLAGVALLTGMTSSASLWLVELMILPFGILGIPLTLWAVRHWPFASPAPQFSAPETPAAQLTGVIDSDHHP